MSKVNFPPRIRFSRPYNHAVEMSITDFENFGDELKYISEVEVNAKTSQLEERLRIAEDELRGIKHYCDALGKNSMPEASISRSISKTLAAIKEKK